MSDFQKDAGPAFPTARGERPGLELRDYFAAKAMQGIFSIMGDPIELQRAMKKGGYATPTAWVAGTAYEMADAMLKAREGSGA